MGAHIARDQRSGAAIALGLDLREVGWDCLLGNGPGTVSSVRVQRGSSEAGLCQALKGEGLREEAAGEGQVFWVRDVLEA